MPERATTNSLSPPVLVRGLALRWAVALAVLVAWITPALSQVLTVEPSCGKAGDSIHIGGSGWAEPQPPCDYRFFFDGAEFASRQPDGLFGPPNRTGTVPGGAAQGDHTIRVELRQDSNNNLGSYWIPGSWS